MGSEDGITWEELLVLEDQGSGEFALPAILTSKDGTVHLTYTYNRKSVSLTNLRINDNQSSAQRSHPTPLITPLGGFSLDKESLKSI
jgi:predicted neuraminidase